MKIKFINGILIIDILTLALVLVISLTSFTGLRVILGLPFILFFPGYILFLALFPDKEKTGSIEQLAISGGMSIAIVALIGLGLNYSPWGISLNTLLFFTTLFIMVMSIFALARSRPVKLITDFHLNLPSAGDGVLSRSLTLIFILVIVSAIGILIYAVTIPRNGEKFTEFYTLGINNKAEDYPSEFEMQNGKVTGVQYIYQGQTVAENLGKVTLGIINQEQQATSYTIVLKIDGQPADINYKDQSAPQIGPLNLKPGEKWEQSIGFAPTHIGNDQKAEFQLFKDNGSSPSRNVILWINAREAG